MRQGGINEKELSLCLSKYLEESVRRVYLDGKDDQAADPRFNQIQSNLDMIADDVRQNLSSLYRRGEKFELLD